MTSAMTVAVTGGTGFVGRHVIGELLDRGHRVRALVRDAVKAAKTLPDHDRLEWRVSHEFFGSATAGRAKDVARAQGVVRLGEGEDGQPIDSAPSLEGCDACVHLIGIIREAGDGQTFERIHVELTRRVLEGCRRANVARYVHMSALGAGPEAPSAYGTTKFEAERLVRRSNVAWTIFRPGLIHGADGEFSQQVKGWVTGRAAPFVFLPYFQKVRFEGGPKPTLEAPIVAPVHVDDVAWAFAEALRRPEAVGEVFNLVGPEAMAFPAMLEAYRDRVPNAKTTLKPRGLPGPVAVGVAKVAGALGLRDALPFDAGMAQMGSRDSFAELDKARVLLGFEPRGFTESLSGYAGSM